MIGYSVGKILQTSLEKKINYDLTFLKYNPKPLSKDVPYIYHYRRSIVPEVWGNSVGEVFNRGVQIQYESLNKGGKNE
ncbi:hypothetical protein GVX81_09140 [[Haemophilus] felis]|uniref:Uncharacterized protein n=1 Tax=[Haemophilus] felis TaxID=123822 RepID=A0A1T0AX77_9PAST|nr:hypothetical protein [[Haemophilus] felis]OOS02169.1 hypothetical protein B0188_08930 [[Haemophilus] felis]